VQSSLGPAGFDNPSRKTTNSASAATTRLALTRFRVRETHPDGWAWMELQPITGYTPIPPPRSLPSRCVCLCMCVYMSLRVCSVYVPPCLHVSNHCLFPASQSACLPTIGVYLSSSFLCSRATIESIDIIGPFLQADRVLCTHVFVAHNYPFHWDHLPAHRCISALHLVGNHPLLINRTPECQLWLGGAQAGNISCGYIVRKT
jgi:hypothetical protein